MQDEFTAAMHKKWKEEQLIMFKEKLRVSTYAIYTKKDDDLLELLNFHVQNLISTGIPTHVLNNIMYSGKTKVPPRKIPEKLTLPQLEGILWVCAALYAISALVFVLELILWKLHQ